MANFDPLAERADTILSDYEERDFRSRFDPRRNRYWVVDDQRAIHDLKEVTATDQVCAWHTARLPLALREGDRVILWDGAPRARVVGIGEVGGWERDQDNPKNSLFWIVYQSGYMGGPTLAELRQESLFAEAGFLKTGPSGLTPLSDEQARELARRLGRVNSCVAQAWPDALPKAAGFALQPGRNYRVLSVHPHWAWSIIFGGKDIENRNWRTNFRGTFLIHASAKRLTGASLQAMRDKLARRCDRNPDSIPPAFPVSSIIGAVDIVDCVEDHPSSWAEPHQVHWVLKNPRPLAEPVTNVMGKLSLWSWTCPTAD